MRFRRRTTAIQGEEMLRVRYLSMLTDREREEYAHSSPEQQQAFLRSFVLARARLVNPRLHEANPAERPSFWKRLAGKLSGGIRAGRRSGKHEPR